MKVHERAAVLTHWMRRGLRSVYGCDPAGFGERAVALI